jgi:hypothetical protein
MAILSIMEGIMTKGEYESLGKKVNWKGKHPAGLICHTVAFSELNHIIFSDVWESQDAMDTFYNDRMLPGIKEIMIAVPTVNNYPVHDMKIFKMLEGMPGLVEVTAIS